jgi:hypothetical protein
MKRIMSVFGFMLMMIGCQPRTDHDLWKNEWSIIVTSGEGGVPSTDIGQHWIAGEVVPGHYDNRPFYDPQRPRAGVLELHPLSELEPARIMFTGSVPMDQPVLVVEAGGNIHGDGVLECWLNDELIGSYTLDGSTWTTCRFDLSGKAFGVADLQLWAKTGGKEPWHFEHLYINDIRFSSRQSAP